MQLNVKSIFLILLSDFERDFMDIIYFLAQIDRLRKERKMTKAEFYEKASVTASAVSQWRNEKTVPAETTIQRIADLFGVEVSFLTGQKEIPPTEKVVVYKLCNIPALKRERGITYNCRIFRITPLYTLGLATCSVSIKSSIIPHTCSRSFPSTSRRNSLSPYLPTSTDISAAGAAEYACS